MSSRRWTIVLCAWTVLVWTTRINNIWGDDALTDGEKWGRTGLALSFTLLVVATVLALRSGGPWRGVVVKAFAGWTIGVWVVRAFGIAMGDHEATFIAVHLVLAAISIALSALALREEASAVPSAPAAVP
jgi:hypothetical protein